MPPPKGVARWQLFLACAQLLVLEGVREDVCCFLRSEQSSERLSTQEAGCLASQLWAQMSGASWGQTELDPSRHTRSTSLEAWRQQGPLPGERLKGTGRMHVARSPHACPPKLFLSSHKVPLSQVLGYPETRAGSPPAVLLSGQLSMLSSRRYTGTLAQGAVRSCLVMLHSPLPLLV